MLLLLLVVDDVIFDVIVCVVIVVVVTQHMKSVATITANFMAKACSSAVEVDLSFMLSIDSLTLRKMQA